MKFPGNYTWKSLLPITSVLLYSLYPVLVLYAHNADELVFSQLFLPFVLSLLFSMILFGLLLLILKKGILAGLAAILFLIIFWNYGLIYMGITKIVSLKHWHLIPLLLFIYFHLVYFIAKIRQQKTLNHLNTIFLLPISLLVTINIFTILPSELKKISISKKSDNISLQVHSANAAKNYPDIYLILLDEYSGFKTIKEEWGYDNSPFMVFLKEKGFFIAEESHIRTASTLKSMSTILNLEYVDENLTDAELFQKYNDNLLFSFLDKKGYKIVFLDGCGRPEHTLTLKNIQHVYFEDKAVNNGYKLDEFADLVVKRSMLSPFLPILVGENSNEYYLSTNYFFNYINNYPSRIKQLDQPAFLYAHINCPHLPYVFDRHGNFSRNPTNYWEYGELDKSVLKNLYLEQYIFVTQKITGSIDEILKTSVKQPVIILLSDHGPRLKSAGIENELQSNRVLNAVYLPHQDYTNLYDSMSPVNTVIKVLNKYFNEHFKLLEDK
jgi:hypothetical protein